MLIDELTSHHHPPSVEGRPRTPASAPLRAQLGNRPALRGERHARPCPPLRLCIAPRLGPASSAYVLPPARVSRLPFAAARTALRQVGCCSLPRSQAVVGCGCPRGPHRGVASATPWRRRLWAFARQPHAREQCSGSPRHRSPRQPRDDPSAQSGGRGACAGTQLPPTPAPQFSLQGSGRPFIAPARPSTAPHGVARRPAALDDAQRCPAGGLECV